MANDPHLLIQCSIIHISMPQRFPIEDLTRLKKHSSW
jgi:hypothetical protein